MLVAGFTLGLIFVGLLRSAAFHDSVLTPYSGHATLLYVALTIVFAVMLVRSGLDLQRLGFARRPGWRHVALALAAVGFLQAAAPLLEPLFEDLLGADRDLDRFDDVSGSVPRLLAVLALSWTFAAFGEEIAFRVVLLGGLRSLLPGTTAATVVAVVLQAAVFGLCMSTRGRRESPARRSADSFTAR